MPSFASALVKWQAKHGRRDLPWQHTRDPYRVWLSEVMLQQTQVPTVIPYYQRFLKRFPSVQALASASQDEVLRLWSGLGYYARGRNLHAAARIIAENGFPSSAAQIAELPGVGRSTAAAVAAFAFGERAAILDGNVKRVLARRFAAATNDKALWPLAERLLPRKGIEIYTQALMDLGATVCTRHKPRCDACPLTKQCIAKKLGRIDELPAARRRNPLPQKSVAWLVLRHQGEVLLEKRPAPGIWGGLWSFPEAPARDIERYCRAYLGLDVVSKKKLQTLEHGFTHFRLRIRPLLCEVAGKASKAESPGRLWIDIDDATGAAVPSPVRKLLGRLSA
ncbi:MAG: A/G-specific adenine glycosylase [Betaproteobacteria bacterium]|nr:MAG: A/G-specific adenine glycosylase [Betaproteobacteria bacterium]